LSLPVLILLPMVWRFAPTSPKVRRARRNILELILARHAQDCLHCDRSGTCELQAVAQEMHFVKIPRYPFVVRSEELDCSSASVLRNSAKCITCGRCEYVCAQVQTVHALSKVGRGFEVQFRPVYGRRLGESVCVNCGQCVQACPTGALTIQDETQIVWHTFADPAKTVIAQVAPAVRVTLAEALGEPPGSISTGRMVTAMKRLGFHRVFDTDFTADLTIMEEGTELLGRIKNTGVLPMITSCCPAWIKFCETFYPEFIPNLSTCKSPQAMFGALLKTYYAEKTGKASADILSVSVMPCTAKKYEEKRPELGREGIRDIDAVISAQELARMIRSAGISFDTLPDTPFDAPFGLGSGAGEIFGATGGVMEAALRTVHEIVTGKPLPCLDFMEVRGLEGIKEATVSIGSIKLKTAVVNGLGNARKIMDLLKQGKAEYHFIEVMACPGGCIGGAGNPIKENAMMKARLDAVYKLDKSLPLRKSHDNPAVKALYTEYLGEPGGHRPHALLHTVYADRSGLLR